MFFRLLILILSISSLSYAQISDDGSSYQKCQSVICGPPVCVTVQSESCGCTVLISDQSSKETIANQSIPFTELRDTQVCYQITGCHNCLVFKDVELEEDGEFTITLSLVDINDNGETSFGTFNDAKFVGSCQGQCKNACSDHGRCLYDGTCDCNSGYSGEDCSESCNSNTNNWDQIFLQQWKTVRAYEAPGSYQGFFEFYGNYAYASLQFETLSNTNSTAYIKKYCQASSTNFDYIVQIPENQDDVSVSLFKDCEIGYGDKYFVSIVSDDVKADVRVRPIASEIRAFSPKAIGTGTFTPYTNDYFVFDNPAQGPFTLSLIFNNFDRSTASGILEFSLLNDECPTGTDFLMKLTNPQYMDLSSKQLMYTISLENARSGTYYVRLSATCTYCNYYPYQLRLEYSYCGHPCGHGICGADGKCACEDGWSGDTCNLIAAPVPTPQPPNPTPTPPPTPSPTNPPSPPADDCNPTCVYGVCYESVCHCDAGYTGAGCTIKGEPTPTPPPGTTPTPTPATPPPLTCVHGTYDDKQQKCVCDKGYTGATCDTLLYPDQESCEKVCLHGVCKTESEVIICGCDDGYGGTDCTIIVEPKNNNTILLISIGIGSTLAVILFVVVAVGSYMYFHKKKNAKPDDTLYTMISQEDNLFV